MENITTWILAVTIILYNQVVCSDSNNFEVFHVSGTSGLKSQSLQPEPLYNEQSPSTYLSSDDRRITRNAIGPKNDYVESHNAFLWKYFDKAADYRSDEINGDDDGYAKTNDKYQQVSDDDQEYDNYGKTNDKYQQVPDVEQFEKVDSYDQAYDDYQYDRISGLSHKQNQESKQNPKDCKIVVEGEMKCNVCKDSAGTHSKSCSFDFAPAKQKYAYTKQRLTAYNSENDDNKEQHDSE